jgi:hypothetical protein
MPPLMPSDMDDSPRKMPTMSSGFALGQAVEPVNTPDEME